jgi:hypothetical protein
MKFLHVRRWCIRENRLLVIRLEDTPRIDETESTNETVSGTVVQMKTMKDLGAIPDHLNQSPDGMRLRGRESCSRRECNHYTLSEWVYQDCSKF